MSTEWDREGGGTKSRGVGVQNTDTFSVGYENGDGASRDWERGEPRRSQSPRSRSPRRERTPRRYFSHPTRDIDSSSDQDRPAKDSENTEGSNLFVSGIAPRLAEEELEEMFGKYGRVEKVNIMLDPHSRESRGFGFVKMTTSEEADAAKDALTGEERYGRVLSIEKARRARPRTPTPGKYFGPPKRTFTVSRAYLTEPGDMPPRGPPRGYDRGYGGRDRYDRGYDDRYDGRRRDYDSYDRYERPRYDDRYQPSRSSRGGREDYYYDSRR